MTRKVKYQSHPDATLEDLAADISVIVSNLTGDKDDYTAEQCAEILSYIAMDIRSMHRAIVDGSTT